MVAVDGSNTSYLAVQEAIKLSKALKAKLKIIYIVDETMINNIDVHLDVDTLWNGLIDEGRDVLNKLSDEMKQSKITFETSLIELKPIEGRLAEKIVAEAKAWPADLLVIGTHGRRGFNHLFLGTVAEHVVRIATMPVQLVRGQ